MSRETVGGEKGLKQRWENKACHYEVTLAYLIQGLGNHLPILVNVWWKPIICLGSVLDFKRVLVYGSVSLAIKWQWRLLLYHLIKSCEEGLSIELSELDIVKNHKHEEGSVPLSQADSSKAIILVVNHQHLLFLLWAIATGSFFRGTLEQVEDKMCNLRSSLRGPWLTNMPRIREETGSISGLAQWVKYPALLWLWLRKGSGSLDWTSSLGTSMCCRRGSLKKKKRHASWAQQ